jgi:diguanylate cyclase (GGDEF)-like protein
MTNPSQGLLTRLQDRFGPALTGGPPILAFLPAITLAALWFGGELALILVSLGFPLILAVSGGFANRPDKVFVPRDSVTGLLLRDQFDTALDQIYEATAAPYFRSACFVLELDDHAKTIERHGQATADLVLQRCSTRIVSTLREGDTIGRIGEARFAICLTPVRQLDLESFIQMAGRIQSAIEEAIPVDGLSIYISCSIGFCLRSRAPGKTGQDWLFAATDALTKARQFNPSTIRAYSKEIHCKSRIRCDLRDDAASVLENGQVRPWFQPQISTETGRVSGFEALARWTHPTHGLIAPDMFLPVLGEAGLMKRLGQVMLCKALSALKSWDSAGLDVPRVAFNFFATDELRDSGLVNKI